MKKLAGNFGDQLSRQIPIDRRLAYYFGREIPVETCGAAMFVDLSGFTDSMEQMIDQFGVGLGEERLLDRLNELFTLLVSEVHNYRGVVIDFAGDGFICWFDQEEKDAIMRAVHTAFQLQEAIDFLRQSATVAGFSQFWELKIGIAHGDVRRLLVGDPKEKLIDLIVGDPIAEVGEAEKIASPGQIVVTRAVFEQLVDIEGTSLSDHFFSLTQRKNKLTANPWVMPTEFKQIDLEVALSWQIPELRPLLIKGERIKPTLRPATAFFMKVPGFGKGSDIEIRQFVLLVQKVIRTNGGHLLQVTTGDKGSYFYAVFGAQSAQRNVNSLVLESALTLLTTNGLSIRCREMQIGLSRGKLWMGLSGSPHRSTYVVMGHDVNLAARLMVAAEKGVVLLSKSVATPKQFRFLPRKIQLKNGHVIEGYQFLGRHIEKDKKALSVTEYQEELAAILGLTEHIMDGRFAGLLFVHGQFGMGKSQLFRAVAEKTADQKVQIILGGGIVNLEKRSYPFLNLIRDYFHQSLHHSIRRNQRYFDRIWNRLIKKAYRHQEISSSVGESKPIFQQMLGLIPENEKIEEERYELYSNAIAHLILLESKIQPLILQIEDLIWRDRYSIEIISLLLKLGNNHPLLILVSTHYEPTYFASFFPENALVEHIKLKLFTLEQTEHVVTGMVGAAVSDEAIHYLWRKSLKNPYFLTNLVSYCLEKELFIYVENQYQLKNVQFELPTGTETVLVSLLDQLEVESKKFIQVAAILGERFDRIILEHIFPDCEKDIAIMLEDAVAENIIHHFEGGYYQFVHHLLWQVIYSLYHSDSRKIWHEKAALIYESLHAKNGFPVEWGEIGAHFFKGGNWEKAKSYLSDAVQEPVHLGNCSQMLGYLDMLLKITGMNQYEQLLTIYKRKYQIYEYLEDELGQQRIILEIEKLERDSE